MDQNTTSASPDPTVVVAPVVPPPIPSIPLSNVVVTSQTPQTTPVNTSNSSYNYAGFFRRYFASMIDGIILGMINGVLGFGIGFIGGMILGKELQALSLLSAYGVSIIIMLVYYLYFIGNKGQTPGKMALGIKVVKLDASVKVGYTSAFLREFIGKLISLLVFGLGYLWMLWDIKKQTWHDKIANTVVVRI